MRAKEKQRNTKRLLAHKPLNPPLFANSGELTEYARSFLEIQLKNLKSYADKAIDTQKAADPPAFPILLYSLSVIDFLGALYAGNASNKADYSTQTKDYLVGVMGWDDEKAKILRALFRNKLAHLAAPAPAIQFDGKRISWQLTLSGLNHFQLYKLSTPESYPLFGPHKLEFEYRFVVSISVLYWDIQQSVQKYLDLLEKSPDLQTKFTTAIAQIFGL